MVAAAEALRTIARMLKTQQFRLARLPGGGAADLTPTLERCAQEWSVAQVAFLRLCARQDRDESVSLPEGGKPLSGSLERSVSALS